MLPDQETSDLIRTKLLERREGGADYYDLNVTRADDGRRVPIQVATMPVCEEGTAIGARGGRNRRPCQWHGANPAAEA